MQTRLLQLAPYAWAALIAGLLFVWFSGYGYDDPYITYRYASNLARGAGFVYNPGERVLSTTTPLYALALAGAGALGADIPRLSVALGAASLALGGLLLWELGQAWHTPLAGLAGLLIYPLAPLLITTLGSETPAYLALVLAGFLAYARERYAATAALLGLATLVRADGALAAVAVAVAFLVERRSPIPWRAAAIYAGLVTAGLALALAYFGAPLPVTLAAKRRQGLLPASELFLPGLLRQARDNYWRFASFRPACVLAAAGVVGALAQRGPWLLVLGWSLLYTAAYTALGVTSYFWYYGPVVVGFVALAGLGLAGLGQLAERWLARGWAAWALKLLLLALALRPLPESIAFLRAHPDARQAIYRSAGEWLREHTPPESRVGALEVGIIGYYADRPMIDFAGLIQPAVAQQLGPASSYDDAALWAFERHQPGYLVLTDGQLPRMQAAALAQGCQPAATLRDAHYPQPLIILACASP